MLKPVFSNCIDIFFERINKSLTNIKRLAIVKPLNYSVEPFLCKVASIRHLIYTLGNLGAEFAQLDIRFKNRFVSFGA